MKYCAFLVSAMMASVSAFAPSSKVPTTTALNQAIDYNPNLGGPTSSDPVDQTLMNMVRSLWFLRIFCFDNIFRDKLFNSRESSLKLQLHSDRIILFHSAIFN